jgi:hypothetical protein
MSAPLEFSWNVSSWVIGRGSQPGADINTRTEHGKLHQGIEQDLIAARAASLPRSDRDQP